MRKKGREKIVNKEKRKKRENKKDKALQILYRM